MPGFSGDNLRDIIVAWPHWRDRLLTDRIAVRRIVHDGLPPDGFPPSLAFGLGCAWRDARGEFSGPTSQPVNILLSGRRGSLVDEARHWRTLGFFHFKLKVAKGDSEEVAIVESLAGEVGPERLRLDANRRWSFDVAKSFFLAIRDCEPDYVEEPLRSPAELDSLYEATGLPLAYDETLDDLKPAMLRRARGVKALVLKPSLVGGLVRNETWVRYARAMGAQAVVSSGFNSSLGLYHLCHLARNWDASGIPAGLATVHFNRNEPILDPGRLEDGCLFFREAPRVDWAKCEPVD